MSTAMVTSNSINHVNYNLSTCKGKKEDSENSTFSSIKVSDTARGDFNKSIATTFMLGFNGSDLARATAWYAEGSTEENPILSIEYSNGEEFICADIKINDIDPSNATDLEMFALCSYADDHDQGVKSTFGTYQAMKNFKIMAEHNGYIDNRSTFNDSWETFSTQRRNWQLIVEKVTTLLSKCHDATQYKQGETMLKLFSDRADRNGDDSLKMKQNEINEDWLHTSDVNTFSKYMKNQLRGKSFDTAIETSVSRSIRTELAKSAYL